MSDLNISNYIMNTTYPFHKIDMANPVGFTTTNIFFSAEPPDPEEPTTVSTTNETLIYQFAHGYDYLPSTWIQRVTSGLAYPYITLGGALPFSTYARFSSKVDDTYIYYYIQKQWGRVYGTNDDISGAHVQGKSISIRCNVFVEDLSGTMV